MTDETPTMPPKRPDPRDDPSRGYKGCTDPACDAHRPQPEPEPKPRKPLPCWLGFHGHWKVVGAARLGRAAFRRRCLSCGHEWHPDYPRGEAVTRGGVTRYPLPHDLKAAEGVWRPSVGDDPPKNPFDRLADLPHRVEKEGRKPPPRVRRTPPPPPPPPPARRDPGAAISEGGKRPPKGTPDKVPYGRRRP